MKKTDIKTLIEALKILSRDIQSEDGVANMCILEGAERLEELNELIDSQLQTISALNKKLQLFKEELK